MLSTKYGIQLTIKRPITMARFFRARKFFLKLLDCVRLGVWFGVKLTTCNTKIQVLEWCFFFNSLVELCYLIPWHYFQQKIKHTTLWSVMSLRLDWWMYSIHPSRVKRHAKIPKEASKRDQSWTEIDPNWRHYRPHEDPFHALDNILLKSSHARFIHIQFSSIKTHLMFSKSSQ